MYRYYRTEFTPSALWCDLSPAEWLIRKMQFNLYMQTATWLVSRELAEKAGPWDTRLLVDDDGEYFCRVLLASDGVRFVPESKVYYRTSGPASLSFIGHSDRKRIALLCSMELHIKYIRSLEDSQRVREACVTYLQNWVSFFYPDRADLVKQIEEIASSLGGKLQLPVISWKAVWVSALVGRELAKRAQVLLVRFKWSLGRLWDKILFRIEGRRLSEADSAKLQMKSNLWKLDALSPGRRDLPKSPSLLPLSDQLQLALIERLCRSGLTEGEES